MCSFCEFDEEEFQSQSDLEDHMQEEHYFCKPCKRYFESSYDVDRHDIKYHNMCDICRGYFSNDNELRMVCPLIL
jgi:hypothetical protein